MKTNLAYASNCSDSLYSFIYSALQQRSGTRMKVSISRLFPPAILRNKK
ncbi:Uncharacterised protein [Escherichia coli]|uniref:Uncharacterized protein n=1 Tax=Escherichia coli TaxID=562 RepID=A0A377F553_ECOLX|nr:Uncharacterised protein [Escherichia coli]